MDTSKRSLNEAKCKLKEILKQANRWNVPKNKLRFKKLIMEEKSCYCAHYKTSLVFIVFVIFGYYLISRNVSLLNGKTSELCSVPAPDFVNKLFRPPVHCDICTNLTSVEKISKLSKSEFEEKYAYTGRPVVITDATKNWSAIKTFDLEFFKKIYEPRMDSWSSHNCQFFPYQTNFRHLSEFLNKSIKEMKPWYVGWSNCDLEVGEILRAHYERPYFLPSFAEGKKIDWIFMGSPGFGAPIHIDNVQFPSWQAQLKGRKKWILQPPPECFYTCHDLEVIVEPGEIIILDTNRWYHGTMIVSKEISITIGAEFD